MQDYTPPIDDYRFLLEEVLEFDRERRVHIRAMSDLGKDVDASLAAAVLEEGGKFCAERLHPLNREGDEHGSALVNGDVIVPPGFAEAYRAFSEAGWPRTPRMAGRGCLSSCNFGSMRCCPHRTCPSACFPV